MDTRRHLPAVLAATLAAAALFGGGGRRCRAQLLDEHDVDALERSGWIEPPDRARAARVLGPYTDRVERSEGLDLGRVRPARFEALACVLGRAAARHMNLVSVFTDRVFRSGSLVVLLDGPTLARIGASFDLHTVFPPAVEVEGRATPVRMTFLVAGGGRLLIGYDGAGKYRHPDRAYSVLGSRSYAVHPFVRMGVGVRDGKPALLDIAVADGPAAPAAPFEGPWSTPVHNLSVRGGDIEADAFVNQTMTPPPVRWHDRRPPDAGLLGRLGCPPEGAWMAAPSPAAPPRTGPAPIPR